LRAAKWLLANGADVARRVTAQDLYITPWEDDLYLYATALHVAACEGHVEIVEHLVRESNMDVNAMNGHGEAALHIAAQRGHLDVMKFLFAERHVDLNVKTGERHNWKAGERTALHCAAKEGHLHIVNWLVDKGADVGHVDGHGETPFSSAVRYGHFGLLKRLVGANGHVKPEVDFEVAVCVFGKSENSRVPLKCLLEQSPDVDTKAIRAQTALLVATKRGSLDVIKWLDKEQRVDLNARDQNGRTALHIALESHSSGNDEFAKYFADAQDVYGRTVRHIAREKNNSELMEWLVEQQNVDVNIEDLTGWTALHSTARNGNVELVQWLVQHNADVHARNITGWTALLVAANEGHLEVLKWLVENTERNVNVNDRNCEGWTALHCAASKGKLDVVRYLMMTGKLDVNAKNEEELTAAHLAARSEHWDIVSELVEVWNAQPVASMLETDETSGKVGEAADTPAKSLESGSGKQVGK
jgi:ankyrin repeat protein